MANTQMVIDRIEVFRTAWRNLAPGESFAGMTLAEFEAAVDPSLALRGELADLEKQAEGKRTERANADETSWNVMELVVNSVRGTPAFGSDSALYRAFGYVRKSERRSGLTRKGQGTAGDANAA